MLTLCNLWSHQVCTTENIDTVFQALQKPRRSARPPGMSVISESPRAVTGHFWKLKVYAEDPHCFTSAVF